MSIDLEERLERAADSLPTPAEAVSAQARRRTLAALAAAHDAPAQGTRARRVASVLGVIAAVAAVLVAALAWPFGSAERATLLERALAAAGEGPVLHVVFRFPSGSAIVDLETGEKQPLYREREVWWDPERGIHEVWKSGGEVLRDHVWEGAAGERHLRETVAGFTTGYRDALANGEARLAGEGVISGRAVYWIRWEREPDPDLRGLYVPKESGEQRELLRSVGHEVAVDRETMRPVYVRELINGEPGPNSGATVAFFESVPRGQHQFVATNPDAEFRILFSNPARTAEPVALSDVASVLGRRGVWLGTTFRGMTLASVTRHDLIALERGLGHGGIARDHPAPPAVELAYGSGDERVTLVQARAPHGYSWRAVMHLPPKGAVVLAHGFGYLRDDELALRIRAPSERLTIAAARSLKPMPR